MRRGRPGRTGCGRPGRCCLPPRPPGPAGGECLPDGDAHDRAHGHLLRPQPHRPDDRARGRADRAWTRAGHLPRRPNPSGAASAALTAMRCHSAGISPSFWRARATASDAPRPTAPTSAAPCRRPAAAVRGQRRPGEAADRRREADGGTGRHAREVSREDGRGARVRPPRSSADPSTGKRAAPGWGVPPGPLLGG